MPILSLIQACGIKLKSISSAEKNTEEKNLCNALKKFSYYSPFIHASSSSLLLMPFGDSVFSSDAVLHRTWNFSAHLIKELSERRRFFSQLQLNLVMVPSKPGT